MQPLWKITWQYLVRLNIGKLYDHLKKKKKSSSFIYDNLELETTEMSNR